MLNKNFFRTPIDFEKSKKNRFAIALGFSFIPDIFLFLLKPYPLGNFINNNVFFVFGYGVVSLIVISIGFIAIDTYYKRFNRWNILTNLIYYFILVTILSAILTIYHNTGSKLQGFVNLSYAYIIYMVFILTALLFVILLLIFNVNEKNIESDKTCKKRIIQNKIVFKSKIKREGTLSLKPNDILYIKSDNNYCIINYYDERLKFNTKMFRISLKEVEQQLLDFDDFIRCHKSYIVNKSKIDSVIGNSVKKQYLIKKIRHYIPVSRKLKIKHTVSNTA